MVDETDGIEEAVEGQMRLLVTAAAQAGDRLARMREDALRRAQATSEREARELQSRLAAEQRSVRADLAGVQRADWWEKATPERIAQAYESAVAWRDEEPEAARAEQRIVDELRTRHGITPDQLRAQVQTERESRQQEPTFAILTGRTENNAVYADLTKEEALERLERMEPDAKLDLTYETWIGKDPEVDRAIAAKFPQIMTEEQRDAVRRAEAEHQRSQQPRFEVYEMVQERDSSRNLSKAGALEMIERTAGTQPGTEDRQLGSDMRRWVGEDPDVDRALARTHPQLLTEEQLAAIDRAEADHQRQAEQRDRAEAAALMAEATAEEDRAQDHRENRPDRPALAAEHEQRADSAREEAGAKYDSAERRASTAADLESQGHDHETVARQMRADVSQGAPATEATKGSRAPRARKGRGRAGTSRQRERGGLSR